MMQLHSSILWRSVKIGVLLLAIALPARAAERSIDREIIVPVGLDAAWAAWTTRDGITSFFAPDAVVDARAGGAFHVYISPLAEPGMNGADDMRFSAVQPKQMNTFDWNAPPHLPEARAQRTLVIVRFATVDDSASWSHCTTPAGAMAANGTRLTPTSTALGALCWPI